MTRLNWVDAVVVVIIALNGALGLKRGIFREAFNLAGIVLGLLVGFRCYEALGWNIEGWLDARPAVARLAAFVAVFLALAFGASYVGYLLHKGARRLFVGWLDRLAGAVFGLARGLLFASVAALVLALFPLVPRLEQDLTTSVLGPHVVRVAPAVYGFVITRVRGEGYGGLDIKNMIDEYLAPTAAPTAEPPAKPDDDDGRNTGRP